MITRHRARTALAELQQHQVHVQVQSGAFVKPQETQDIGLKNKSTSSASGQQSSEGVEILAKKMNVISLDSSSEGYDEPNIERNAIDLSESSQSVIDLSSADDDDGEDSEISEDEDGDESEYSEDENRGQRKSSSSTPASKLLAEGVAKLIRGGDLKKLKVDDCRTYLRNYGLRVTGTKPVLIDRIKQHIELKEGGLRSYDRSTFIKDCTGDVCKGDVVIFDQKVYNKHSGTSKSATQAGSRTVAGRVVKESYGAQRQQHTFTVEVLWSTGCRPKAPMTQLLVKGRILYKRRTFRQLWADEGERQRTLQEKHERGAAARQIKAMKHARFKGHPGYTGQQGNAGRFGLEGPSRKQLANPYADTLASKENSKCSSGTVLQSAVSVHKFAADRTQQHVVHHHPSTGANTVPLGRIRQFGLPSENGEINGAVGGASKQAAANTRPLDKPFGNGEINEAGGGATTSVNKHRQWLKPAPLLLPTDRDADKQQRCEAQNVSSSSQLPGASAGSQSGPRNSGRYVSIQAPITSAVSQGAGSTSRTTQSHDDKRASSLNRPSSPLGRPASPLPNRPSVRDRSLRIAPSSPLPDRLGSRSPYGPGSPRLTHPQNSFPCPTLNRPSFPFLGRPASPFPYRPAVRDGLLRSPPSSPLQDRLGPRSLHWPPSPKLPHPQNSLPCPTLYGPSSPSWGRPASPFPNRPSVRDGLLRSAPSSPLPDRLGCGSPCRPPSPKLTDPKTVFPVQQSRFPSRAACLITSTGNDES